MFTTPNVQNSGIVCDRTWVYMSTNILYLESWTVRLSSKTAEAESSEDDSDTQLYSAAEAYEKAQADLKKATERQGQLNEFKL